MTFLFRTLLSLSLSPGGHVTSTLSTISRFISLPRCREISRASDGQSINSNLWVCIHRLTLSLSSPLFLFFSYTRRASSLTRIAARWPRVPVNKRLSSDARKKRIHRGRLVSVLSPLRPVLSPSFDLSLLLSLLLFLSLFVTLSLCPAFPSLSSPFFTFIYPFVYSRHRVSLDRLSLLVSTFSLYDFTFLPCEVWRLITKNHRDANWKRRSWNDGEQLLGHREQGQREREICMYVHRWTFWPRGRWPNKRPDVSWARSEKRMAVTIGFSVNHRCRHR